jgi:hypothetical protein
MKHEIFYKMKNQIKLSKNRTLKYDKNGKRFYVYRADRFVFFDVSFALQNHFFIIDPADLARFLRENFPEVME